MALPPATLRGAAAIELSTAILNRTDPVAMDRVRNAVNRIDDILGGLVITHDHNSINGRRSMMYALRVTDWENVRSSIRGARTPQRA
jgi:hypothetical protein